MVHSMPNGPKKKKLKKILTKSMQKRICFNLKFVFLTLTHVRTSRLTDALPFSSRVPVILF